MAFETRGGGTYYYRKERQGKQVFSRYIGNGRLADITSSIDADIRDASEEKRLQRRREKEKDWIADSKLLLLERAMMKEIQKELESKGYHKHKGEFRRERKKAN
jgi:4-alpha-glucanotransferase